MKTIKKSLTIALLSAILISPLCAQETNNVLATKKGKPILPVKGQIAIGFDATPVFTYVGNLMNLDNYNTLNMSLLNNQIYGKYMIGGKSAVRVKLHVNNRNSVSTNIVQNDAFPNEEVEDQLNSSVSNFLLSPGYEMRTGTSRFQLIYGGELIFGLAKQSNDYSYGNAITLTNTNPTTTTNFTHKTTARSSNRILNIDSGSTLSLGLRAFAGIEYFVLPKISLGTEVGLSYVMINEGSSSRTVQFWDYTDSLIDVTTDDFVGNKTSSFSNDILNGRIFMMFYF